MSSKAWHTFFYYSDCNFTRCQLLTLPMAMPVFINNVPVLMCFTATVAALFSWLKSLVNKVNHTLLLYCCRNIVQTEGIGALFKGLGPNLVGVAPSRYANRSYLMHFSEVCSLRLSVIVFLYNWFLCLLQLTFLLWYILIMNIYCQFGIK